jgi:class 3 adenylate cyclase
MALVDDLKDEVSKTFKTNWTTEKAIVVPSATGLLLNSNYAKELESATVMYADMDGSTHMVDTLAWGAAAEVYKAYLRCASKIIKSQGGVITAYDGDRVMAVFMGKTQNTSAVSAALKINRAVIEIIRPAFKAQYPSSDFVIKHVIGIDTSRLHAARIGVIGDNDIVWVGSAANHAAKLCNLNKHPIWITPAVHDAMHSSVKLSDSTSMWTRYKWNTFDDSYIYGTNYYAASIG